MKNKVMAMILGTVLAFGALAGCGQAAETPATETTAEAPAETKEEAPAETKEEAPAEAADAAEEKMVDVGGDFEVSTKYAEYQLVEYYIAEMDETPVMVVARTADKNEYQAHFNFFGDEQLLEFTVDGDKCEVTNDLTGFMAKDVDNIYAAIKAQDNWQPVQ